MLGGKHRLLLEQLVGDGTRPNSDALEARMRELEVRGGYSKGAGRAFKEPMSHNDRLSSM